MAQATGLVGEARNLPDGRVLVVAEGERAACERLLAALRGDTPGHAATIEAEWGVASGEFADFSTS